MTSAIFGSDLTDAVVTVVVCLVCFMAGVAWAAYRALSWADRIHAWAAKYEPETAAAVSANDEGNS